MCVNSAIEQAFHDLIFFLVGIRSLMNELHSILECILQMSESLAASLRHNNSPSKIIDATKMALRQLAIGEEELVCKRKESSSVNYVYLMQL